MRSQPGPPIASRDENGITFAISIHGFQLVELITHALEQMRIRGITREEVFEALRNPDKEGLPTQPGRKRVRWNKTGRVAVDVVYEELPDRIRVITAIKIQRRLVER